MNKELQNQQLPNHRDPPEYVDLKKLFNLSGVEYFKVCISYIQFIQH